MTNMIAQSAIPTEKTLLRGDSPGGKTKKFIRPTNRLTTPGHSNHSNYMNNKQLTDEVVHPLKVDSDLVTIVLSNEISWHKVMFHCLFIYLGFALSSGF